MVERGVRDRLRALGVDFKSASSVAASRRDCGDGRAMEASRICAAFTCRERAVTTRSIARVRRRENPSVDGWAMAKPGTVHVCEHHLTAPEYQLDLV